MKRSLLKSYSLSAGLSSDCGSPVCLKKILTGHQSFEALILFPDKVLNGNLDVL